MKTVIDVSYYQMNLTEIQWSLLSHMVDGVIIRLGFGITLDSEATNNVYHARKLKIPYTGYWWVDPTKDISQQRDAIAFRGISIFNPPSMFLDMEQYWSDWSAYMRMDLTEAKRTRFSKERLGEFYKNIFTQTKKVITRPIGIYSGGWFVDEYAPDLATWIYKENFWGAEYLHYTDPYWWNDYKKMNSPIPINKIDEIVAHVSIWRGIARQFESYIPFNSLNIPLDWNVFTDEGFAKMFNQSYVPGDTPPVSDPYEVTATHLNIRSGPGTTFEVIGSLPYGKMVVCKEIINGWMKIEEGWVSTTWLRKL